MERQFREYTIFDAVTPVAITSSTDATPIVVTATAHGLNTGDYVLIQGHTTNIAANGIFKVIKVTANSFQLTDRYTGAAVVGSGAGAGSSGFCVKILLPHILDEDFIHGIFSVATSGSATVTFKAVGSIGKVNNSQANVDQNDVNFGATQSASNPYGFIQVIDYNTDSALNGTTGVVISGTDIVNNYEFNINGLKYINVIPTSWTQGAFTIKLMAFNNK